VPSEKSELRRRVRAARDAWSPEQRADASAGLCAAIVALRPVAGTVMSYVAFGSEADLSTINDAVLADGHRLLVPRVEGTEIVAVERVPGGETRRSSFGIEEPVGPPVEPAEIDLVLAPGVAFDRRGGRLGYGAGYYDGFLPKLPAGTPVIGVCFSVQVVDAVPVEEHDVRVDVVVSERGVEGGRPAGD